jgi:hypothetical protein
MVPKLGIRSLYHDDRTPRSQEQLQPSGVTAPLDVEQAAPTPYLSGEVQVPITTGTGHANISEIEELTA